MKETLERVWSSNIGDYDAYWDDIYDVHGYWIDATENPEDAEYTLEELEQTKFEVPDFVDWLILHQEQGWSIEGVCINREEMQDPSEDARPTNLVVVTRITVKFSREKKHDE